MRCYLSTVALILFFWENPFSFPCNDTYYAKRAELIVMQGSEVTSLQKISNINLELNWDAIPKIPGMNYRIPIQFTSTCDNWGEHPASFVKRDSNQAKFTLEEINRFSVFTSSVIGLPQNKYFIISKDKQSEVEFIVMGENSIHGFYAAARYVDTLRNKDGQLRYLSLNSLPWWIDLDSARFIDSLKSRPEWKTPPDTGDSLIGTRHIDVQMLKVYYDTVKSEVSPALSYSSNAVKISRRGGLIEIVLPQARIPSRMKILTTNGRLVRELRSNSNTYFWDGTSSRKDHVPQGLYLFEADGIIGKIFLTPK